MTGNFLTAPDIKDGSGYNALRPRQDACPTHSHSTSAEQHCNLPGCCCQYLGSYFTQPTDTILGPDFKHHAVFADFCTGKFSTWSVNLRVTHAAQMVKMNKEYCTRMLEQIHSLLYGIIQLHMNSDTGGELSPNELHNLAKFAEYFAHISIAYHH